MNASFRRLASDHAALRRTELPPYYLWPTTAGSDELNQLNVLLTGPCGTPYEDGMWRLQLKMPADYPKSPPKAFFRTKIWHPNVDESNGSVCLDTLKRDWESRLTLRDILITIACLLINPNPDSALNSAAGHLLQENWNEFARHAKLMTSIHAKIPTSQRDAAIAARNRGNETTPSSSDDAELDVESEDEDENTKENDASLAPPPRPYPSSGSIVRPSVLGKRPLADLPVPLDLSADDEDEDELTTCSARNIAANTPNLSNQLASVSFDGTTPVWSAAASPAHKSTTTKLVERLQGVNAARSLMPVAAPAVKRTGAEDGASPPIKRLRVANGKENADVADFAFSSSAGGDGIGLGIKSVSTCTTLPVRKGPPVTHRPKARVGMRRL